MTPDLLTELQARWPVEIWGDVPVAVAVSGGADSVALAAGLVELRSQAAARGSQQAPLVIAHLDHGLRPDSRQDAELVERLAQQWGTPVICERASALPGDEGSARSARYDFYRRVASQLGARYLAVAHTADDQVETVLHRILRGTGMRGLAGVPKWRRLTEMTTLVRPLLDCRRTDVIKYLRSRGLPWNEDSTNQSPRYTRNRIRHELLPLLETDHPQVRESILRLASHAAGINESLEEFAADVWEEAVVRLDEGPRPRCDLDVEALRRLGAPVMVTVFQRVWSRLRLPERAMDAGAWRKLCRLAWMDDGAETLPGSVHASRIASWLVLQPSHEN